MSRVFNTEIISVGTELLLGHVANTDARDVSEKLAESGINVKYHTVVGDNPERLLSCIEIAKSRADIIITTGGLGPTCDDLTKQTLAAAFGLKLILNEAEYDNLRNFFAARRKKYTENNTQQAMLPEGCTVFHNNCGTAPGCAFEKDGIVVIMLPGPPKECRAMLNESVVPYLKTLSDDVIVSHSVRLFGISESAVDDMFAEEMNAMVNPTMAPYAKECDCLLKVTARAKTHEEAEEMIAPVVEDLKGRLGECVYGVDVENLEEAVFNLLKEKKMTFCTAESCTGGDVARRFTDMPGASGLFKGGVVTYTNEAKTKLLGIPASLIEEKSAVSFEVAKEMAERARVLTGSDIGIGITGVAGPDGDGIHEVGRIFVSMAVSGRTYVRELSLGEHRTRSFNRQMAGNHAFDMMRRYLTGLNVQ